MYIKRFVSAVIMFSLVLSIVCSAFALTSAEKENSYNAAFLQLESYLESAESNSYELQSIANSFDELGSYNQSKFLRYYALILVRVAEEDYNYDLATMIDMVNANTEFRKYLEEIRSDSSIGTVDELISYVNGRENEYTGNITNATECYKNCLHFYDASDRYFALQRSADQYVYDNAIALLSVGDYAGAYYQFDSIAKYSDSNDRMNSIINQLGYVPVSATDNLKPVSGLKIKRSADGLTVLSWNKSEHATSYEVAYKQSNVSGWISIGEVKTNEATFANLSLNTLYDFNVVAKIGRIKSQEAILTGQTIPTNTPVPITPTPTIPPTTKPTPSLPPTATPIPTPFKPSSDSVLTNIIIGYACHGKIIWTEERQVYTGEQWIEGNLGNYNYVFMGEDDTYWNKTNNNNVRYDAGSSKLRPYYIDWKITSPYKAAIKMNIKKSMENERGVNVIFNVKFAGNTVSATISKSKFQYRNLPGGNSTYKAIYGVKGQTIDVYAKKKDTNNQWWVLFDANLTLRTESLEVDPNQKPVNGMIESWWTPVNECLDANSFNLNSVPLYDDIMFR